MRGNESAHGLFRDGFEKEPRAVELVERVGAFENFVENNQGVAVPTAKGEQLFEPEQFGVEVGNAVGEVVAGAHTAE